MNESKNVKIVVFVPLSHTNIIRETIGNFGAGKIGNYTFCSFSSVGVGRFKPEKGANPAIGNVGELESVEEERIEFVCERERATEIIEAIKKVHPYEEVAFDIYSLLEI